MESIPVSRSAVPLLFAALAWITLVVPAISFPGASFHSGAWAMDKLQEIHVLGNVSASRKRVSLMDLVDRGTIPEQWQKSMAAIDIGEAPSVGSQKYIDPRNLHPFLCQFIESQGTASAKIQIHMPERIVVERKSIELSQDRIEEIYRKCVADNAPWDQEEMVIQRITTSGHAVLPDGEVTHEVAFAPREKFIGNVTATIDLFVDGEKVRSLRVTGKIDVTLNVVQLTRPLKQNEIIGPDDLETRRIVTGEAPDRFITRPEQAVGKRLVRNTAPQQPLEAKDLDKALVLKRGDLVTIVYDHPGLRLTARGQVKEDGAAGDNIRVHNSASNKTILCRVVDAQTVQATQ